MPMRIDQYLAHYALFSRKEAGKLIRSGQVLVNNTVCKKAAFAVKENVDIITCQGQVITALPKQITAVLYKPPGYLTAARDKKQATVMEFIPPAWQKLGLQPVGRLDKDTSGALLFTTDGQLAHRLLSPKKECTKRYLFAYRGDSLGSAETAQIADGTLVLDDGPCQPGKLYPDLNAIYQELHLDDVELRNIFRVFDEQNILVQASDLLIAGSNPPGEEEKTTKFPYHLAALDIHEGRFHQVKRMLLALNREIIYLHRLHFAGISVAGLAVGESRLLTVEEVMKLKNLVGLSS